MLKFYAVEQGRHDDWQINFVLATSPEDAGARYLKHVKKQYESWLASEHYNGRTVTAKVYETDFDEFGVLVRRYQSDYGDAVLEIQVPD